jgi:hypothetical protein
MDKLRTFAFLWRGLNRQVAEPAMTPQRWARLKSCGIILAPVWHNVLLLAPTLVLADSWMPPHRADYFSSDNANSFTVLPHEIDNSLSYFEASPVAGWPVSVKVGCRIARAYCGNGRPMVRRYGKAAGANKQTGPFWQSDGTGFDIGRNFVAAGHHRLNGQYSPSIADLHRYAGEQT